MSNEHCQIFNGCAVHDECPLERAARTPADGQPYQIHVTVKASSFAGFKELCHTLGLKALLLDNQLSDGGVSQDMMTSSTHRGDDESAKCEMERIARVLGFHGYKALRSKIETVPWHEQADAPTDEQYFEAHVTVTCPEKDIERLTELSRAAGAHMSGNVLKRFEGGLIGIMATIRKRCSREEFEEVVREFREVLEFNAFGKLKVMTEFTLFDNNEPHDSGWINREETLAHGQI